LTGAVCFIGQKFIIGQRLELSSPKLQIDANEYETLESNQLLLAFYGSFMPLYEYQCKKCHHRFEKIQKFSDPPVKKCPECRGPVEQLLSPPAVQFKGSGWYVTDYARKSSAPAARDGESGSKKDDKKEGKKETTTKAETSSKKDDKHK
jgi:putative FmdB family regulatory protein